MKFQGLRHPLLIAAVAGIAFCAYSNSLHAPFILDNDPIILKDPRIREVTSGHIRRILSEQYWPLGMSSLFRPLTTMSFMLNYTVLGNATDSTGYHWFNFLVHAINIGLVYALGMVIFEQVPAALLLSALWGLHPVLTESVTNIVGRADMLAAFGVLAGVLAHRKAVMAAGSWKVFWLAAMALAVTIGIFSKEGAIVVLAVIPLYDFTFGRAASWRSRLASYIAVAVPCVVFLYLRANALANSAYAPFPFGDNPLVGAGFWTARLTAFKVIGRYILLLAWPARLSYDYSYNEIPLFSWGLTHWEDWMTVGSLAGCLAAAIAAVRSYPRRKPLFFAIAFFFATLAPASNLVILIGSIMAERFLYLPSLGFAAVLVCAGLAIWQRLPAGQPKYRYAAGSVLAVILIAFAVRIYSRNADWLDPGRFWQSALDAAPGSYKTNLSAANNRFFLSPDDVDRSIREVGRALAILDPLPDLENVGGAYREAGIFYFNLGERLSAGKSAGNAGAGTNAEYWYRRALQVLSRSERIELVQDEQNRQANAQRGKPGLTFVPSALYLQIGRTYQRLSDPQHALAAFERGHRLESDPDLLEELASAYQAAGDVRKAALALVEALAVDSSRVRLSSKLVELYAAIDPQGCAVSRQGGTLGLNVECPLVHRDICTASRNVALTYLRTWQHFEYAAIRRTAIEDLGCAPELLN